MEALRTIIDAFNFCTGKKEPNLDLNNLHARYRFKRSNSNVSLDTSEICTVSDSLMEKEKEPIFVVKRPSFTFASLPKSNSKQVIKPDVFEEDEIHDNDPDYQRILTKESFKKRRAKRLRIHPIPHDINFMDGFKAPTTI